MLLNELRTLPEQLVGRLDPVRVQEYVRAAGWQHRDLPKNGHSALYQRPHAPRRQILVPLTRKLADFAPRMAEAVAYIAEYEQRPAVEVLADLLLPESDILRFHEVSPAAATGDVPLEHGLDMLVGAQVSSRGGMQRHSPRPGFPSPDELHRRRSVFVSVPPWPDGARQLRHHRGVPACRRRHAAEAIRTAPVRAAGDRPVDAFPRPPGPLLGGRRHGRGPACG